MIVLFYTCGEMHTYSQVIASKTLQFGKREDKLRTCCYRVGSCNHVPDFPDWCSSDEWLQDGVLGDEALLVDFPLSPKQRYPHV